MILTSCVEHRHPVPCPECVARVLKCPRCGGLLEPVAGIGVVVPHDAVCHEPGDPPVLRRLSAAGRVVCVGERPAGGGRLALWVAMDSGAQPVEVG